MYSYLITYQYSQTEVISDMLVTADEPLQPEKLQTLKEYIANNHLYKKIAWPDVIIMNIYKYNGEKDNAS